MVTKKEYLEEIAYVIGPKARKYEELIYSKPNKQNLVDFCEKEVITLRVCERVALKRALKHKKIKYNEDIDTAELVQLAYKNKINFDTLDY